MDLWNMIFQGWPGIIRTIAVGILAYISLIAFLRISGKRTLAKLNAFDLVVTVALGSTLSAILLQESVALAEGATALALLILMQFFVTSVSVRSPSFAKAVRAEPALLVKDGLCCTKTMRRERITPNGHIGERRDFERIPPSAERRQERKSTRVIILRKARSLQNCRKCRGIYSGQQR
jgi:hypothetical protein